MKSENQMRITNRYYERKLAFMRGDINTVFDHEIRKRILHNNVECMGILAVREINQMTITAMHKIDRSLGFKA